MRVSTALNHRWRLANRMAEIYRRARYNAPTHAEILAQIRDEIHSDPAWTRVPSWVQSFVNQCGSNLLGQLYRPDLSATEYEAAITKARDGQPLAPARYVRWSHWLDGREVTTDEICTLHATDSDVWNRVESRYVWNHDPSRPF